MKMRMILGVAGIVVLGAGVASGASTTETLSARLTTRKQELERAIDTVKYLQGACAELDAQLKDAEPKPK